jgi:hypothetical protein
VRDASQFGWAFDRGNATAREYCRGALVHDDRLGRKDSLSVGKILNTQGDVDRLAEVVLPVVQRHREAWPLVDADLQGSSRPRLSLRRRITGGRLSGGMLYLFELLL